MKRIRAFEDGRNPWELSRLKLVEAGTSCSLAAIRMEFETGDENPVQGALALGLTVDQARIVADLLNEAADIIESIHFPGK